MNAYRKGERNGWRRRDFHRSTALETTEVFQNPYLYRFTHINLLVVISRLLGHRNMIFEKLSKSSWIVYSLRYWKKDPQKHLASHHLNVHSPSQAMAIMSLKLCSVHFVAHTPCDFTVSWVLQRFYWTKGKETEECVNTDKSFFSQGVLEQSYWGSQGWKEAARTACSEKAKETSKAIDLLRKRKEKLKNNWEKIIS